MNKDLKKAETGSPIISGGSIFQAKETADTRLKQAEWVQLQGVLKGDSKVNIISGVAEENTSTYWGRGFRERRTLQYIVKALTVTFNEMENI